MSSCHTLADQAVRSWNEDVIYFIITDRFLDGDLNNNQPEGIDPTLLDPTRQDIHRYHGGDFRGIEIAIRDGYFEKLGITAIWMTPPIRNAWNSSFDLGGPKTGYHGYWSQDFLDIDPHWISKTKMDGTPYSDDRDGRMQHYCDLVKLAHDHGIKIIQDIVCNHVGPLFYYDSNGNESFDLTDEKEWITPYVKEGFYSNTRWADVGKWNLSKVQPDGPKSILGHSIETTGIFQNFNVYGRKGFSSDSLGKSDGEEIRCDFLSLRDIYTGPDSPFFDRVVDEFVEIYRFYVEVVGVDGFRIDTIKHVDHEFWDAFTQRLRSKLGADRAKSLLLFGEVYDGNPAVIGRYTYRTDFPTNKEPCLDSLLNFQFCFNLRDYLRVRGSPFGSAEGLRNTMNEMNGTREKPFYNPSVGLDGLSANQKLVNFYENHDGLNRFLAKDVAEVTNKLALGITIFTEGIPCLYYGTELPLQDTVGEIGRDGESGRMTLCGNGDSKVLEEATKTSTFSQIHHMINLRNSYPALSRGEMNPLWVDNNTSHEDDGVFSFARYLKSENGDPDQVLIVVVNANPDAACVTAAGNLRMSLVDSSGKSLVGNNVKLRRIAAFGKSVNVNYAPTFRPQWTNDLPSIALPIESQSIAVFVAE